MNAESEDDEIPCTIWIKKLDGTYTGCLVKADGELTRTGVALLSKYPTLDAVKRLVSKRVIWSVRRDTGEELAEFYSDCKESLMKMQARECSEYCYIFDEKTNMWRFGVNGSQPLDLLVQFIQRS